MHFQKLKVKPMKQRIFEEGNQIYKNLQKITTEASKFTNKSESGYQNEQIELIEDPGEDRQLCLPGVPSGSICFFVLVLLLKYIIIIIIFIIALVRNIW